MESAKLCTACGELKPITEFHKDPRRKDWPRPHCKACMYERSREWFAENKGKRAAYFRTHHVKRRYRLTVPERDRLFEEQKRLCSICNRHLDYFGRTGMSAQVDHDHRTARYRGILCGQCNRGIGMLGDSVEGLGRAVRYLCMAAERAKQDDDEAAAYREWLDAIDTES